MNFKSQIATTRKQSERLLALGVKPETADMYLSQTNEESWEHYETDVFASYMDKKEVLTTGSIFPEWSLSRLLEMMPKSIEQVNRPNADLDINSDGKYWFISYEELGYDVVHQEMKHDLFDCIICTIQWLIDNGHINKEYLK